HTGPGIWGVASCPVVSESSIIELKDAIRNLSEKSKEASKDLSKRSKKALKDALISLAEKIK
ncbi:MAG: hypothetical protein WA105_06250, partial [Candidatus Hydromicrobium sp.]